MIQQIKVTEYNKIKSMTTRNIANELLFIFKDCIGYDNKISKSLLFEDVYKIPYVDSLGNDLRWEYLTRAILIIRRDTKCFVVSEYDQGENHYYILNNEEELERYQDVMKAKAKKIKDTIRKAKKSIEEKWFKKNWVTSTSKKVKWLQ